MEEQQDLDHKRKILVEGERKDPDPFLLPQSSKTRKTDGGKRGDGECK